MEKIKITMKNESGSLSKIMRPLSKYKFEEMSLKTEGDVQYYTIISKDNICKDVDTLEAYDFVIKVEKTTE
jgi:hypothetical protein